MLHATAKAPLLIAIDEELHDVRRVLAQGEEDDLRGALQMMIRRVEEMKGLIVERDRLANSEKEKALAVKEKRIQELQNQLTEQDVELGVTRSNLRMVTANNEMLEEALRGGGGGLGWHRRGESNESSSTQSHQQPPAQKEDSKFFSKFRFASRPGTPNTNNISPTLPHAASTPNLGFIVDDESREQKAREDEIIREETERREKELQESLDKERRARADLEAELESLSQALFEEANKMVSTERRRCAEIEEELREAVEEKEALRRALRVVEGENVKMRASSSDEAFHGSPRSTSSSLRATKSRPSSYSSTILQRRLSRSRSPSPTVSSSGSTSSLDRKEVDASLESLSSVESQSGYSAATEDNTEDESEVSDTTLPVETHHRRSSAPWEDTLQEEPSPWADIHGSPPLESERK